MVTGETRNHATTTTCAFLVAPLAIGIPTSLASVLAIASILVVATICTTAILVTTVRGCAGTVCSSAGTVAAACNSAVAIATVRASAGTVAAACNSAVAIATVCASAVVIATICVSAVIVAIVCAIISIVSIPPLTSGELQTDLERHGSIERYNLPECSLQTSHAARQDKQLGHGSHSWLSSNTCRHQGRDHP